jgi:hypothetical protein
MNKIIHNINVLSEEDIFYLLNLPDVINAKKQINEKTNGSIYFTINLTESIKRSIYEKMSLDLTNVINIPMRWIKGDTLLHNDIGINTFDNTYLIYLTDSDGFFIINDSQYLIKKGSSFIFKENMLHGTINTGDKPRLLLGPMSEIGNPVGIIYERIYIRQYENDLQFSSDLDTWFNISWPFDFFTYNVEFITNITLTDITQYFICVQENMQFGLTTLNLDGSRPIITISGIIDYPGLVQNGTTENNGFNNIRIFNLEINVKNSTLVSDGGWFGQTYFCKNALDNYVINCSSNGQINDRGGGIIGSYSCNGNGVDFNSATLYLIGCCSKGNIGEYAGGIIGNNVALNGGKLLCDQCWQEFGEIGNSAGGIVGSSAANGIIFGGNVTITKCYSKGNIFGENAGGIIGENAGFNSNIIIEKCYSQGNISGPNSGGIYGYNPADSGGITIAENCYSSGSLLSGLSNGIFSGGISEGRYDINCYVADISGWNNTDANNFLSGTPNPFVGTIWVSYELNQPYELNNMGYTPYTIENILISEDTYELNKLYNQTIIAGESTISGIIKHFSSKGNILSYDYTIGRQVTKDMGNEIYTQEFDPFENQDSFFPEMAEFISDNIIAGDKTEDLRLIASFWEDIGNDIFDDWGYFYLYDVESGKYYFPLIDPQNQNNGIFNTQTFNAFGRIFTITHGWCVQGIFKFDITVNDSKPFKFGAYGNMGSDGDENITDLTYAYNDEITLHYQRHAEENDTNEILYSYWIPKKISQNSLTTYDFYYDSDDNSMMSKEINYGLLVYFAKSNDVIEWIVNDLTISSSSFYNILQISDGNESSYDTITINNISGVISTINSTISETYTIIIRNIGSYNITQFNLTVLSDGPIPCLTEDTNVLTPYGYINITKLKKGNLIITDDNRNVQILNIYINIMKGNIDTYPCIIPKNSIGNNYPQEDFKISQNHLIKYNNKWILPKLFFKTDVEQKIIKYYHIELENYLTDNLVINNGVVVESYGFNFNNNLNDINNLNINEYNKRINNITNNLFFSNSNKKKIKK